MSFLSPAYFFFFPITVLGYFLLPQRGRCLWLLLASWVFCLCAGPEALAFLLGAILVTYLGGRWLEGGRKKAALAALLGLLFGVLFLFKYLAFALDALSRLLAVAGLSFQGPALDLLLPAGISFYLFQAAGYLIDVYRGDRTAERSFVRYALFLSFFPHLLSGPIARAGGLLPQLREKHAFDYDRFRTGLLRFAWGAFLKLVLADRLAILVNTVFAAPQDFGALNLAAAAGAFSVQIYCDFSAYSHMALGAAESMGFRLMENFRTPYFSRSIAEFWRRWHISLSSWFRDYLYIPLGGGRKGTARKYLNVLIVFAVSGLWHGAAASFVVWGLLNGLYQVVGGLTAGARARVRRACRLEEDSPVTALWQMLVTFFLATVAWVFFKAGSVSAALAVFRGIVAPTALFTPVGLMGLGWKELLTALTAFLLLLGVDLCAHRQLRARLVAGPRAVRWALVLGLLMAIFIFGTYGTGYDPQAFIYFKF